MSAADRDLAEAIYAGLTSEHCTDAAVQLWLHDLAALPVRDRLERMLALLAKTAINTVLARRQREAARAGPWEGGHHAQEEDGYPGSLAARCHTVVLDEGEGEP